MYSMLLAVHNSAIALLRKISWWDNLHCKINHSLVDSSFSIVTNLTKFLGGSYKIVSHFPLLAESRCGRGPNLFGLSYMSEYRSVVGWIQVTAPCPLSIWSGVINSIIEHRVQSHVLEAGLVIHSRVCSRISCVLFESPLKAELVFSGQAFSWCLLSSPCSVNCSELIASSLICYYSLFADRKLRKGGRMGKNICKTGILGLKSYLHF